MITQQRIAVAAVVGICGMLLGGCAPVRNEHDSCVALAAAVQEAAAELQTVLTQNGKDPQFAAARMEEIQASYRRSTTHFSPMTVVDAAHDFDGILAQIITDLRAQPGMGRLDKR